MKPKENTATPIAALHQEGLMSPGNLVKLRKFIKPPLYVRLDSNLEGAAFDFKKGDKSIIYWHHDNPMLYVETEETKLGKCYKFLFQDRIWYFVPQGEPRHLDYFFYPIKIQP